MTSWLNLTTVSPRRRYATALVAILGLAFVLRVAARAMGGAKGFWENSYFLFFELAQQLAKGQGYSFPGPVPTAFRVPLYPIFIALVTQGRQDFWALLIAQSLISTATVACVAGLALLWFGRRTALVASAIAAVYPYYLWHDTALQETGLFTFLSAFAMLLLVIVQWRRSPGTAVGAGFVLGLAILTRATLMPFALFAVGWLLLPDALGHALRRRTLTAALCCAALVATLSPWLLRTHALTGRYTLGTEFGAAVFIGNNDATFSAYPTRSMDRSRDIAMTALSPADKAEIRALRLNDTATSDWFLKRGLGYIAAHPGTFVLSALRKNMAAFGPMPSPARDWKGNLVEALSYGPILLLGLIGAWWTRRRWRSFLPVYAHFVFFAAITGVLWGHSSHRTYLTVYLIIFAAHVLATCWSRFTGDGSFAPARRPG
jgi:4-amino-4-deoxy-L-arabinose transferase-like glycosyltransferase